MKNRFHAASHRRFLVLGILVSTAPLSLGCSPAGNGSKVNPGAPPGTTGPVAAGGATGASGGVAGPGSGGLTLAGDVPDMTQVQQCKNLQCQVPVCAAGAKTTISGKVYDPAGNVPLYNVLVYVPNEPVPAFTDGASCDRCGANVLNPVTSAVTDESGAFVLDGAPAGANIPIVIQVGKWRRQLTIPAVNGCTDNPQMDPQVMRLPRNKAEGDIPKIAIAVGAADQMECLPLRLGIDPAEFTTETGSGRINLYTGDYDPRGKDQPVTQFDSTINGGATFSRADTLWNSKDALMKYDIVILSCEGDSYPDQKSMAARQAMYDYSSAGGRVFASHWHNVWFADGPQPLPTTGTWSDRKNPMGETKDPIDATINQSFPKGAALAQWALNVNASTTLGTISLVYSRDNLQAANDAVAREWITLNNPNPDYVTDPKSVQYMSFNTPIGATDDKICGREVYTDLHVASVDNNTAENAKGFPASCELRDLSPQEKIVAFMLFDLSACVTSKDEPQKPPK
jgi:hypothetical protein